MKFTNLPNFLLASTVASSLASPVSGGAASTGLRGNGGDGRKLASPHAADCLIQASALLKIPGAPFIEDLQIECEMDAADANGKSGQTRGVKGNAAQMAKLKQMVNDGRIVPGASRMDLGNGVGVGKSELVLPPGFDPEVKVKKGPPKGQGKGNGKGKGNGNYNPRRRLDGDVFGNKPILVVRVTDDQGLARPESAADISADIFGSGTDQVNLKSQLSACSFDQLNVVPGDNGSTNPVVNQTKYVAPGVIEVTIPINITDSAYDRYAIHNEVTAQVQDQLGFNLPGPYEQVMYVLEKCYTGCGWAAYASINSWMSVYQDEYYKHVGVQVHELGHNFGLAHSGGLDGAPYTDHTGMMGNPLYSDEVGKMCYNAAKNWQIGWYNDKKLLVEPLNGDSSWSQTVTMVGIADYQNNLFGHNVVVKLETGLGNDYFVAFNRATGVNSDNDEADDEVTVVQVNGGNGESYSQSFLKATLLQGETYTISSFGGTAKNVVVEVINIDLTTSPGTATILFHTDQVPTAAPTENTLCDDQPGTKLLQVNMRTDNYNTETSWALVNQCTQETEKSSALDIGSPAYPTQNTEFMHQWCVPEAEYIFTIVDSFGDGICCSHGEGWYNVVYGSEVVAEGGSFASSDSSAPFGNCNVQPTTPPPTNWPTNFPTPPPTNLSTPPPTPPPTTTTPPPTNLPTNFPTPPPTNLSTPPPTPPPTTTTPPPTNLPTNFPTPPPTNLSTLPPTNFPTPPPTNVSTPPPTQLCKLVNVVVTDSDGHTHTLGPITIPSGSEVGTVYLDVIEEGRETCPE